MYFSHAGSNPGYPHFFFLFIFYMIIIWPFPVSSVCVCLCVGGGGGGGGSPTLDPPLDWSPSVGTLIFSSYVGLCPASTVYPPKILGISGNI